MADVGLRVSELWQSRGWTQEYFADVYALDARTLQRIDAGQHITFAMLVQPAKALRVPVGVLFEPPTARDASWRRPATRRPPGPVAAENRRSPTTKIRKGKSV